MIAMAANAASASSAASSASSLALSVASSLFLDAASRLALPACRVCPVSASQAATGAGVNFFGAGLNDSRAASHEEIMANDMTAIST